MGKSAHNHVFDEAWIRAAEEGSLARLASLDPRFSAILALPDFERFVYVLTVIEGYSDQQCAALLDVSPPQIEEARLCALQHFWKQ